MDKTQLLALAQKYMAGIASEEEIQQLHDWYDGADDEEIEMVFSNRQETQYEMGRRLYAGLQQKMQGNTRVRRMTILRWTAAASVAALLLLTTAYLFTNKNSSQQPTLVQTPEQPQKVKDVLPGGDKARLVLANGKVIILDSLQDGAISNDAGIVIRKEKGQVIYDASQVQTGNKLLHNTIITPRGGQYQVVLPDGSKVWLNAASSVRFPTAFINPERKVEITGEAYFEVAKNKSRPFIVDVNGRYNVEVLGTHFNIMAYEDEKDTRTTLLEGKVKIVNRESSIVNQKSVILAPGQQAVATHDSRFTIHDNVDADAVMAWKNGLFSFNNTDIQTIMRQVGRWYNVDITYEGHTGARYFTGEMSRNMNVSAVLKILETAGVHFSLERGTEPGEIKIVVLP